MKMSDFENDDTEFNKSDVAKLPLASELRDISMNNAGIELFLRKFLEYAKKEATEGKLQLSAYVISNNYHPDGIGDAAVERLLSKLKEMGYKCKKDRKKRGSDIALTLRDRTIQRGFAYCKFWDKNGKYSLREVPEASQFYHISIFW